MSSITDRFAIRSFEASDGPFCHRVRRQAFLRVFSRDLASNQVQAGADAFDVEEFTEMIGALDSFVAWQGGARIGFVTIRYPEVTTAEILYVYVDLDHLGEGIGSRLVRHAEDWIERKHPEVTGIVLDTAVPRYNQAFYENLGYTEYTHTVCRYPAGEVAAVRLTKRVVKE